MPEECIRATGDVSDIAGPNQCANLPSNIEEEFFNEELPCIFPYYLNGELFESCHPFSKVDGDFVVPINRCPVRNITTKIDGINSFTAENTDDLLFSFLFCPNEDMKKSGDLLPPLDPSIPECFTFGRGSAFSRCKNNCNRGKVTQMYNFI